MKTLPDTRKLKQANGAWQAVGAKREEEKRQRGRATGNEVQTKTN